MFAEECPVHSAALDSRKNQSSVTLLSRVGQRSATTECATCAFCRKALECIESQNSPAGNLDKAWTALWHDRFEGVALLTANL
ncbi:MAG: hypothetical protein L3K11_03575 [Thermoplasmata archaeon]|nr:hypothetical protein [Thermoplasmata archaeon]